MRCRWVPIVFVCDNEEGGRITLSSFEVDGEVSDPEDCPTAVHHLSDVLEIMTTIMDDRVPDIAYSPDPLNDP